MTALDTTADALDTAGLAALTSPSIVTELPGPIARTVIDRDHHVSSPSLTRLYPLVVKPGSGSVIGDVAGNPSPPGRVRNGAPRRPRRGPGPPPPTMRRANKGRDGAGAAQGAVRPRRRPIPQGRRTSPGGCAGSSIIVAPVIARRRSICGDENTTRSEHASTSIRRNSSRSGSPARAMIASG